MRQPIWPLRLAAPRRSRSLRSALVLSPLSQGEGKMGRGFNPDRLRSNRYRYGPVAGRRGGVGGPGCRLARCRA